ncbi:MAG TPA: hypothetical protein ENI64_12995 [Gammaproteobacteria bacterium]|nr:hypothetical protein [Gammaproteobacteria bacterium]
MILTQIKYLLKSHTGMHIATVGDSILNVAIQTRLRELDIADTASYLALLQRSHAELTELTEEVVIPETWFFRDQHPFEMLGKLAATAFSGNSDRNWRILSVPSSTGEEPYSIAMTLLMAGMKPEQFSIEGVDISQRALRHAMDGHYGQHSFRGVQDNLVRERFFDKVENAYVIKPEIRNLVQFEHANILDKAFCDRPGDYDIIFCRNLLIYFDDDDKKAAYNTLHHLLNQNGTLFIGHSESGAISDSFTHTRHTGTFAYRKSIDHPDKPEASINELIDIVKKHPVRSELPEASSSVSDTDNNQPATNHVMTGTDTPFKAETGQEANNESHIELARRYADAGNLVDAEHICHVCLEKNAQNPSVHCLLGLIQEAGNRPVEAEKSYRKALYLDPHCSEVLIQLPLLLDRQGKSQQAQQLRQRAIKRQEQSA